jgi:light-regulated signal transduction histidine kinase (bacteriophytochrome)
MSPRRAFTDREISDFLLRACHDLRSSVRGVKVHAELAVKRSQTSGAEGIAENLGFMADGARRIDLLVDGLAAYAIALQTDEATFQSTSMEVILRSALAKLDTELRAGGAQVNYGTLPKVRGNPDRLRQVLEALILNSVRHRGAQQPHIQISAERRDAEWLFTVRDDGPGVEAGSLEDIFKPFERLHGKEREGPGMGLTICREIVERHGGRIWAAEGSGATVLFTLPAD